MSSKFLQRVVVASILCAAVAPACGISGAGTGVDSSDILGGQVFTGLPAVGIIARGGRTFCTGTVIAPRKVLTAAHCVDPSQFEASEFQFRIGPTFEGSTPIAVTTVTAHPRYDAEESTFDIALIELAEDAPVEPMQVVKGMDDGWIGRSVLLVGYGVDTIDASGGRRDGSGVKRAVTVEISDINETKFKYGDPGKSACNGDSGGPAFVKADDGSYLIAGVTSCGDVACQKYGVYTRADAFLGFMGASETPDPAYDIAACGAVTASGSCDGDALVTCTRDCFEAVIARTPCDAQPGGRCHVFASRGVAECVDDSYEDTTIALREIKIVDGEYDTSAPLVGVDVFYDAASVGAGSRAHGATDAEGQVTELLRRGEHTLTVRSFFGSHSVGVTKPQPFTVAPGATGPVVIAVAPSPAVIEATYAGSADEALYVTGQGALLGDWEQAFKMERRSDVWVYTGTLPRGIEFKVQRGPATGGPVVATTQLTWEKGGNHTLSGVSFDKGYFARVAPRF